MKTGIVRDKPEELSVGWMENQKTIPLCDLCNKEIDWNPFPVIDYPSDEELINLMFRKEVRHFAKPVLWKDMALGKMTPVKWNAYGYVSR
ncbi:MAG: hypothetical protein AB1798_15620 [Spirochaetota bacterium]